MIETKCGKIKRVTAVFLSLMLLLAVSACGKAAPMDAAGKSGDEAAKVDTRDDMAASDTTLTVTALKGGAADTFVLISDEHVTIIDTGLNKKADRLLDFLHQQGVSRIDELIITHFDKDHVGGADQVLENFEVGKVYVTYHSKESDDITSYLEALHDKDMKETTVTEVLSYEADGISFTIYPPRAKEYSSKTSNNSSLVIRVVLGENSILFAGDAEAERIAELLDTEGLKSTVLKMPHHGRYNYNSEALIKYVSPKYAIITSGNNEPEDQEILDILEENGVVTYLTRDGNITMTITGTDIVISQE